MKNTSPQAHFPEVIFDKHYRTRTPRITSDGHYRFSIKMKDEKGEKLFEVRGFRVDKDLSVLIPPQSVGKQGIYQIVEMGDEWKLAFLKWMRANRAVLGLTAT